MSRRARSILVVVVLALAIVWLRSQVDTPPESQATPTPSVTSTTAAASPAEVDPATDTTGLPPEALDTIELIDDGGPFPYRRDGVVFENRERLLPQHPRGYWHEYTVPTPGEDDRGARRLVEGESGELYYTDDHYRSFRQVREAS